MNKTYFTFLFFVLFLTGLTYWSFSPAFDGDFVLDDQASLQFNRSIKTLSFPEVLNPDRNSPLGGRPISNLSFALNFAQGEFSVRPYRLTNWILHVGAAIFLFLTIRLIAFRLSAPSWQREVLSASLAILWSCHPIQTASVPYISQRTEVLAGFFCLGALCTAVYYFASPRRLGAWFSAASVLFTLLAVSSKEGAAVVPILVLLLDRAFFSQSWSSVFRSRLVFYCCLFVSWALVLYLYFGSGSRGVGYNGGVTAWKYAITQSRVILDYARLVFIPYPLIFDRGISVYAANVTEYKYVFAILLVVATVSTGVVKNPGVWAVPSFFFILLAPSSSFMPIWRQPMAENRMYIALGALLIPSFFWFFNRVPKATLVVLVCLIGGSAVYSRSRSGIMSSNIQLTKDTVLKADGNPSAWINYGEALMKNADFDQAECAFNEAAKLKSGRAHAKGALGVIAEIRGDYAKAFELYKFALEDRIVSVEFSKRIGSLFQRLGKLNQAKQQLGFLLEKAPQDTDVQLLGALIAMEQNQFGSALEYMKKAEELDSRSPGIGDVYASIYFLSGELGKANQIACEGLKANPADQTFLVIVALIGSSVSDDVSNDILKNTVKTYRQSLAIRKRLILELTKRGFLEDAANARAALISEQQSVAGN